VRYALAAALVTFAVSLDAQICAEGIEKESELVALQRLGIAYGQGYFLGRPGALPLPTPPQGVWLFNSDAPRPREASIRPQLSMPLCSESLRPSPLPPSTLASPAVRDVDRLAALRATRLLDTEPEEAFDRFTRLAVAALGAPISLFSLVDQDRQFFKSTVGVPPHLMMQRETPLSHSLCQHVVTMNSPLVVNDAATHPLVRDNPAVMDLGVTAYAGVPVCGTDGRPLGALCVIDHHPRDWIQADVQVLRDLASALGTELELREMKRAVLETVTATKVPRRRS
jgi:hypothetical protein